MVLSINFVVDRSNAPMFVAMHGLFAASEVNRLVEKLRIGSQERARLGLHTRGTVPITHTVILDRNAPYGERLIVNETHRIWLDEAARLLLQGVRFSTIGQQVAALGCPLSPSEMHRLFLTPFTWGHSGYGYVKQHGHWAYDESVPLPPKAVIFRNTVAPVWTGDLAERIKQELRRRHEMIGSRRPHSTLRFSGLLICGNCGKLLGFQSPVDHYHHRYDYYRCTNKACDKKAGGRVEILQAEVDRLLQLWLRAEDFAGIAPTVPDNTAADERLTAEITATRAHVTRLILAQTNSGATAAVQAIYQEQIREAGEKLDGLEKLLADQRRRHARDLERAAQERHTLDTLRTLTLEKFWQLPDVEIHASLRALLGKNKLVVNGKSITHLKKG
jgi:hypothetical protein